MDPFAFSLSLDTSRALRQTLTALSAEAELRYAAICQDSGMVLAEHGDEALHDQGEIGALATGAFATVAELAKRLGEKQFEGLHYQGAGRHFFLCPLLPEFFLLCVFDNDTKIAIVRACTTRHVSALRAELSLATEDNSDASAFSLTGLATETLGDPWAARR